MANIRSIPQTSEGTRQSLLQAAEKLFALHGVDGASVRAITQEAGANLAAVNYHFGSKEGLVQEMFRSRLEPLNLERLQLLEACGDDDLDAIVTAFVAPVLRMIRDEQQQNFACLIGRSFSQPDSPTRQTLLEAFRPLREGFIASLGRALPELPHTELCWRFHFMVGSMAHTVATGKLMEWISEGHCDPNDVEANIRRLVAFIVGGLEAPVSAVETTP